MSGLIVAASIAGRPPGESMEALAEQAALPLIQTLGYSFRPKLSEAGICITSTSAARPNCGGKPELPVGFLRYVVVMRIRNRLLPLLLLVVPLGGCIAVAVGAGVYGAIQYDGNEMSQEYHADLDETWDAAVAELAEMGYTAQQGTKPGPTEGKIEISDVVVRVEKLADERTRVEVRFGTFDTEDHQRKARLLLQGIAGRVR